MKPLLLLLLLAATTHATALDTLYMKPCIMIQYDYKYWGPSNNESNWEVDFDDDGSRFFSDSYLYPGSDSYAELNRAYRNHIFVSTGYAYQLLEKKEEDALSIGGYNDYMYNRYDNFYNQKLLEETKETINGLTYTIAFYSNTYIRHRGNRTIKNTEYYHSAVCDTIFDHTYFLNISTTLKTTKRQKLIDKLTAALTVQYIPPAKIDDIYARHHNEQAFRTALDTSYQQWQQDFNRYRISQLSCSDAETIRAWTMQSISLDSTVELLSLFDYQQLAHIIRTSHHSYYHKALDAYFQYLYKYKYSLEYEYTKYQDIAAGRANIHHFLNYMNDDTTATFLDTLDAFNVLRGITAYDIEQDMESDDGTTLYDKLTKRRYSDVEEEFVRQFSIQHLEGDPLLRYKYRKVLDEKDNKVFLFLPADNYALNSVLGVFRKQADGTWSFTMDQLEFNAEADGEKDFTPFNNLFGIIGKQNCLVLDTSGASVQLHKLGISHTLLSRYPFVWVVDDDMTNKPYNECMHPYSMEIFYSMLDTTQLKHMTLAPPAKKEDKVIPMNTYNNYPYIYGGARGNLTFNEKNEDPQLDELTKQNLQHLTPDQVLYHQPFTTADLNGDGTLELFTYDVCNGEMIRKQCYTTRGGALIKLTEEEAATLLATNTQVQNLKAYSLMGRRKEF